MSRSDFVEDKEHAVELLEQAEDAMDEARFEDAERLVRDANAIAASLPTTLGLDLLVWGHLLVAEIGIDTRSDERAFRALSELERIAPGDGEARYLEGRLRFLRWEFEEARSLFRAIEEPDSVLGSVRYHEAMLAEFAGDQPAADRLFAEAAALDPLRCPLPVRVETEEVLELLDAIIQQMPGDVRAALENVVFDVVDLPDPALDGAPANPPTTLGVYYGDPVTEASASVHLMPHSIRIFRRNIERIADDREHLLEELRVTILHEIGHHLGWDEDDLDAHGLA